MYVPRKTRKNGIEQGIVVIQKWMYKITTNDDFKIKMNTNNVLYRIK